MAGIYYAVVEGDPLDSGVGSEVLGGAGNATIEGPDGISRRQTYLGHHAWCAACQSAGEIVAGAGLPDRLRGWDESQRVMEAVGGDIVLCKCERPPRVVAVYGRSWSYGDDGGSESASTASAGDSRHIQRETWDHRFTLVDSSGQAMPDTH
jgi:hypothetical protein